MPEIAQTIGMEPLVSLGYGQHLQQALSDLHASGWLHEGCDCTIDLIGRGGCSSVYRVTRQENGLLEHTVIKTPLTQEDIELFADERRMMSRVPCAPQCLPTKEGAPYIAMEFVEGKNLDQIRPSIADVKLQTRLCEQVVEAMKTVLGARVIHMDIKPANVMLCPNGSLKILDFGIAVEAPPPHTRAPTGRLRGTPLYMAPEQWDEQVHERTDVFAAGCLLYHVLTGNEIALQVSGGQNSPLAIASAMHSHNTKGTIHDIIANTHIPARRLLERMLALDPEDRPEWQDVAHSLQTMYRKLLRKKTDLAGLLLPTAATAIQEVTAVSPPAEIDLVPTRLEPNAKPKED